jgi:hypothetical protein
MNLSDKALLVQLSISKWTARKKDKKATREVAQANNANVSAGNYHKKLLVMQSLAEVDTLVGSVRTKFYENTLPWGIEGSQILPAGNYLGFVNDYRSDNAQFLRNVDRFVYDYMIEQRLGFANVKRELGSLFNPDDYPKTEAEIRSKFKMDLAVFPVPSTDFRVSVGSDEMSRIQQDIEQRVANAAQTAMQEVWQRLYDKAQHIAKKCADPKAIFHDSMIENAREICSLLPRLNFADDPNLERMRQEVEALLVHPQILRNDPDRRRDTAAEMNKILSAMGTFMGGVQ